MNCYGYLEGVNGVKTGFTNGAGRCLVTSVSRNQFDIITVVLGADTKKIRTRDSIKLIEYTYKNYELVDVEKIIKEEFEIWQKLNLKRIRVEKGDYSNINVELGKTKYKYYPIKKESEKALFADVEADYYFCSPIKKGNKIGKIAVKLKNETIDEIDIKIKNEIPRKNIKKYLLELLKLYQCNKSY